MLQTFSFLFAVPHFEKMLYDQGQLANAYLDAFSITKDVYYSCVSRDILDYLRRDMIGKEGEIFSAEDADSTEHEGATKKKEGAFYIWSSKEVSLLLPIASLTIMIFLQNFLLWGECYVGQSSLVLGHKIALIRSMSSDSLTLLALFVYED